MIKGLLRCGKSCRLRWINYLRTDLKRGNITTEEEQMIVKLHNVFGNRYVHATCFSIDKYIFMLLETTQTYSFSCYWKQQQKLIYIYAY